MKNSLFLRAKASASIFLSFIALFAVQCKREENVSSLSPSLSPLNVDINYATRIANAYQSTLRNKSARLATVEDSLVVDTRETLTDKNTPIFHTLNYKNNKGWIILALTVGSLLC